MKINSTVNINNILAVAVFAAMAFVSCSKAPSVQRYIVDHEHQDGFASFIIPVDILQIRENAKVDKESIEAMDKLNNLVVLQYNRSVETPDLYEKYLKKLHTCLAPDRYEDIFVMNDGSMAVSLKVQRGQSDQLSEVIALVEQSNFFMLARLTGEIEPYKLAKLIWKMDYSFMMEHEQLKGLAGSWL